MDGSLEGAWELVEWTAASATESLHPCGRDATGRLVYSGDGFMSAFLARADGHSDALAYHGSWELRGGEAVHADRLAPEAAVVHHVIGSTRAGFVGQELVRSVSWEGDELVLTTPPRDGWVNVLRWRRAAA